MGSTITFNQMTEIARILGYPQFSPNSSLDPHYPFFSSPLAQWQPYAMLMTRLAVVAPAEEVQILGAESPLYSQFFTPASVTLTITTPSAPAVGTTVRVNLGGNIYAYETQAGDTVDVIIANLAQELLEDPNGTALFLPNPDGNTLLLINVAAVGTDANGVNCVAVSSDPSVLVSFGGTPGQMAFAPTSGGATPPGPQFKPLDGSPLITGYVPIIHVLESDLVNARTNLDTLSAEDWHPRQDELDVREALKNKFRRDLANALLVPLDPDIVGNNTTMAQRFV